MAATTLVVATVTVEVEVGPWGDDGVIRDVVSQSEAEALGRVEAALARTAIRVGKVTSSRVVMKVPHDS